MIGWVIDRDYIAEEGEPSRVGYGMTIDDAESTEGQIVHRQIDITTELKASEVEDPVRFRALDDDGEVYYGGAVTREWVTEEPGHAYNISLFTEADAGAIDVQFRAQDLPIDFVTLHRECNAVVTSGGTDWVIVYS